MGDNTESKKRKWTTPDGILQVKEKAYGGLVGLLDIVGFPIPADPDHKEDYVNDLVLFIIHPLLRFIMERS